MNIYGLQKMTLLDYPGHVACTVFTGGCDFRCPFCHNYDLACGKARPLMQEDELLRFLSGRKGLLDGVAVTGGEPCLAVGLENLLLQIQSLGYRIKLDTNGYHPQTLAKLIREGLVDYVAMDVKNSPAKYAMTAGLSPDHFDFGRIQESIALLKRGTTDYEFRTTVVSELHTAEDLEEIGRLISGASRYFLQSFTDRDQVPFAGLHAPDPSDLLAWRDRLRTYVPDTELRGVE